MDHGLWDNPESILTGRLLKTYGGSWALNFLWLRCPSPCRGPQQRPICTGQRRIVSAVGLLGLQVAWGNPWKACFLPPT